MNTQEIETEVKETLELFSRFEIADQKTLEWIGNLIEQKIRDRNTNLSEAITYLLVAKQLNVPNLNQIATNFYYFQDYQGMLDFYIDILKNNGTIKDNQPINQLNN